MNSFWLLLFVIKFYSRINVFMTAIDLSKQQALDDHSKEIQQINFAGSLDHVGNTTTFFFLEEVEENILDFSQATVRVLGMHCTIN